jgi:glutamyl-tRNA(Gln) amidotransferase subunit E
MKAQREVEQALTFDYTQLGLKVGLEIHQQLNTSTKLFCGCKPELSKKEPETVFLRRLRPTQSELGQVDPAAYFEFQKGVELVYEADSETSCLVEMDEEPPHPISVEAVEAVLTAALMMKAKPVDVIYVMRKTVIDGSNTTGFQRTCVIALDGELRVGTKTVPIQHASLEEDAARKTRTELEGKRVYYRIDRLGIPLIEVATAPVIHSPAEAQEIALAIGRTLRATGKVMRGLGTIRQDLNISIAEGALTEIKGVQELELIAKVVELEVQRQLNLLAITAELKKRGVNTDMIKQEFIDVAEIFAETKCSVIQKALEKRKCVKAVKLPRFNGLLKKELIPDYRFGSELADRAKFWGRVGGIFHTDELPAYGITMDEVAALKRAVNADDIDAIVFVADTVENAEDALRAVVERAKEALLGVPSETRTANADGTTRYMRPRPGAARMYPETDIPPLSITRETVERIRKALPEPVDAKLERLKKQYALNDKLAKQLVDSDQAKLFEEIVAETGVSATNVAAFLTETLKSLKRDGVETHKVTETQTVEIFKQVGAGRLAKEAVADVFVWLSKHNTGTVQAAVEQLGLEMLSREKLEARVTSLMSQNRQMLENAGKNAFGTLMNLVMREVRGKADPEVVAEIIREKLRKHSDIASDDSV